MFWSSEQPVFGQGRFEMVGDAQMVCSSSKDEYVCAQCVDIVRFFTRSKYLATHLFFIICYGALRIISTYELRILNDALQ